MLAGEPADLLPSGGRLFLPSHRSDAMPSFSSPLVSSSNSSLSEEKETPKETNCQEKNFIFRLFLPSQRFRSNHFQHHESSSHLSSNCFTHAPFPIVQMPPFSPTLTIPQFVIRLLLPWHRSDAIIFITLRIIS